MTRTLAEALNGKRGEDFFPDDACTVCGAITYFNDTRYVQDHDPLKHGVKEDEVMQEGTRRSGKGEDLRSVMSRISDRTGAVRRATGDRDDE